MLILSHAQPGTIVTMNTVQIRTHHIYRITFIVILLLFILWTFFYNRRYHDDNETKVPLDDSPVHTAGAKWTESQEKIQNSPLLQKLKLTPKEVKTRENEVKKDLMAQAHDVIAALHGVPDTFIQDPNVFTRTSSLKFMSNGHFELKGRPHTIIGGSMHYFRVAQGHWRDRMKKMRAAGINTLDTYIAWNMHEEVRGKYNFQGMLNIRRFIEMARDVGFHVVIRPGPYIGADLDFGGLPSWLLSDPNMRVRTSYKGFLHGVKEYIKRLSEEIADLQFHQGGPIIAVQVENEYGDFNEDSSYLPWLRNTLIENGFTELLFTSDKHSGLTQGTIPGVLATAKFDQVDEGAAIFRALRMRQPRAPLWVTSFSTGGADYWGVTQSKRKDTDFQDVLEFIFRSKGSVIFYMFHGGTNFGFMSGVIGNHSFSPCITSYDYDAPIAEGGQLTTRYSVIKSVIETYYPQYATELAVPISAPATVYGEIALDRFIHFENVLSFVVPIYSYKLHSMESLIDVNNGGGQGYGFVLYRKNGFVRGKELTIKGKVRDIAKIMFNSRTNGSLSWDTEKLSFPLPKGQDVNMDILVENLGRISSVPRDAKNTLNDQRKGIVGSISIDGEQLSEWNIFPLELRESFIKKLTKAQNRWDTLFEFSNYDSLGPVMLMGDFTIKGEPRDTYFDMGAWIKGVVFINGRNLGRYWNVGPQKNLYVPSPWLNTGQNTIVVFELQRGATSIKTANSPGLGHER